jgi:hypothetical protein
VADFGPVSKFKRLASLRLDCLCNNSIPIDSDLMGLTPAVFYRIKQFVQDGDSLKNAAKI